MKWSPLDTYMVTIHARGIALWGGQDFHKVQKFSHPNVQYIDFSPCERYIVTFVPPKDQGRGGGPPADADQAIIVWEARTGVKKRYDLRCSCLSFLSKNKFKSQVIQR